MRSILIGSQKGGVGKTSLVAALGALAARDETGRRVLLIDGDQQANLSRRNLALDDDSGRGLYGTIVLGEPLKPVRDARPGLDVVTGGAALAMVGGAAATAATAGLDLAANLRVALDKLAASGEYSLVLVDLGPGDVALLDAVLGAVRYVIAPHREDEADLDGVELLIKRVLRAQRDSNPDLTFLGTVAFARDPRATARNRALDDSVRQLLSGSEVLPFETSIRHAPAAARDARALGLTPRELIEQAEKSDVRRFAMLRRRQSGAHSGDHSSGDRTLWSRADASDAVARDYLDLLKEILMRMTELEAHLSVVTPDVA